MVLASPRPQADPLARRSGCPHHNGGTAERRRRQGAVGGIRARFDRLGDPALSRQRPVRRPQPRHHSVLQAVLAGYRGAWSRPTLHLVYAPRGGRFHRDLCEAASAAPGGRGTLFGIARYYGLVTTDEAAGLRLKTTPPPHRIWTDEEVARWLDAAAGQDPHMSTAFLLLQYSAQRPGDVLKMTWPQYSGSAIRLRRQKTGTQLTVPSQPWL